MNTLGLTTALIATAMMGLTTRSWSQDGQQRVDYLALQEKMEEAQQLAAIEADRANYVQEVLDRWQVEADARGHHDYHLEWTERLAGKSAAQLRDLARAETWEDFVISAGVTPPSDFGDLTGDLVFFPLPACRLIDTRLGTGQYAGPLAANTQVSFSVNDSLDVQGGNAAGCNVPGADPPALAVVLTAAAPSGPGNLRSFAAGGSIPTAASLTYTAGTNISNGIITDSCTLGLCSDELTVRNQGGATTHVIVDVVGYFHSPNATPLDCTTVENAFTVNAGAFFNQTASCPAGRTLTGGGYNYASSSTGEWIWQSGPNGADTGWQCRGNNTSAFNEPFTCFARCCRTPGR